MVIVLLGNSLVTSPEVMVLHSESSYSDWFDVISGNSSINNVVLTGLYVQFIPLVS